MQVDSPKRPSLDERLEIELGINMRDDNDQDIPDAPTPPPPDHGIEVPIQVNLLRNQSILNHQRNNQRFVRVGNVMEVVPAMDPPEEIFATPVPIIKRTRYLILLI